MIHELLDLAGILIRTIEDLAVRMVPEDAEWRARLERVSVERDDLESVRAVLWSSPRRMGSTRLHVDEVLADLYILGRDFMLTLPIEIHVDDERLRRAARADPDAWWAEPAI